MTSSCHTPYLTPGHMTSPHLIVSSPGLLHLVELDLVPHCKEGGREGGRGGGREGGREAKREGEREGGREGGRRCHATG